MQWVCTTVKEWVKWGSDRSGKKDRSGPGRGWIQQNLSSPIPAIFCLHRRCGLEPMISLTLDWLDLQGSQGLAWGHLWKSKLPHGMQWIPHCCCITIQAVLSWEVHLVPSLLLLAYGKKHYFLPNSLKKKAGWLFPYCWSVLLIFTFLMHHSVKFFVRCFGSHSQYAAKIWF